MHSSSCLVYDNNRQESDTIQLHLRYVLTTRWQHLPIVVFGFVRDVTETLVIGVRRSDRVPRETEKERTVGRVLSCLTEATKNRPSDVKIKKVTKMIL